MTQFDKWIIDFVEKYLPHTHTFYKIIYLIADDNLLKGGVIALLIWYLWFKSDDALPQKRVHIIATILSSFVTIVVSRVITTLAPFQMRPILNPELSYFSFKTDTTNIDQMSSFPSDHAALFIALAAGMLFVSRRTGIFALIYTSIFILFPRIYLGFHYPTDIIAGAAAGVSISLVFNKSKYILGLISKIIMPFSIKQAQWFYPIFFLITFQIVVLFSDLRSIALYISHFHKI